jgi:hypothetical protein
MIYHSGGDVLWNGARLELWQCEFLNDLWADEFKAAFRAKDDNNAVRIFQLRQSLNAALTAANQWRQCA